MAGQALIWGWSLEVSGHQALLRQAVRARVWRRIRQVLERVWPPARWARGREGLRDEGGERLWEMKR
jgi:hypothetical protein